MESGGKPRADLLREYWEALKVAVADLELTDSEITYLTEKRRTLGLAPDEMRWLHARAFAGILADASEDHLIEDHEVVAIHKISVGLAKLGWTPGAPIER